MFNKLKPYIENISNPLLYYIDKEGNSVFRNFCLLKNSGNRYNKIIPVKEAGKIIEYRIELAKKLKVFNFLMIIFTYLLFIHTMYNFAGLIICEIILISMIFSGRFYCSCLYRRTLLRAYGQYEVTEFKPNIPNDKKIIHKRNYYSKYVLIIIFLLIYTGCANLLKLGIRNNMNTDNPHYKRADIISRIYTLIFPKNTLIYELRAFKNYNEGNFNGAVDNYIKALLSEGNQFKDTDYIKFANLLYFVKKSIGSQNAIDIFNEISTKKQTTIPQKIKLLWIKSIFSISNGLPEFVENDYDDLLTFTKDDDPNKFYIQSDKAYMLYLKRNYNEALEIYDYLISYATQYPQYNKELPRLYVERGFTKQKLNDSKGAQSDFLDSKFDKKELNKYEPIITETQLIPYKL